jgi:aryl-alcohol dehydrogenase-like predicted oxidoreductase
MKKRRIECSIRRLRQGLTGINFIDTADVYLPGAEVGGAEIVAGRWLNNKRAGFILATKGGGKMGPAAWDGGSSRKHQAQSTL